MKKETTVEIAIAVLAGLALLWLWLANTKATGQTGLEDFPDLSNPSGAGASTLSAVPAEPASIFNGGNTTFNLGGFNVGGLPSTPANPNAGVGTCGCGCNDTSTNAAQFSGPGALASFLASLPQYQWQQKAAFDGAYVDDKPIQWDTGQGAL